MTDVLMWPARLPVQVATDPYRAAEIEVYNRLQAQLGARWEVFYSRPWLGLLPTGGERDGECDFVVAHPDHGILFIEVKGGGVAYVPEESQWITIDRHGLRHRIKDPISQARTCKHQVLAKLRAQRSWPKSTFVRVRHAVLFPDLNSVPAHLSADGPSQILGVRPDLKRLGEWVLARLTGGDEVGPGVGGMEALHEVLAKPFQLRVPLANTAEDDDRAIEMLTPQQFHILTAVGDMVRVSVGGGAGTGKTLLAMEDALRLSAQGKRTLLVCVSPHLAIHLKLRLQGHPVSVFDFESLCLTSSDPTAHSNGQSVDDLAEKLMQSAAGNPQWRFDAIVIDEAQDLTHVSWIALLELLEDADSSSLHAYYDSNQKVYGELSGHLASLKMASTKLTRNLRNTQAIHRAAHAFYRGLDVVADGPKGLPVEHLHIARPQLEDAVVRRVEQLLSTDGASPAEVAVLSASSSLIVKLRLRLARLAAAGITVATVAEFKGLERRFVILAATTEIADEPELAYVALSRARAWLDIIGEPALVNWLREANAMRVEAK